MEIEDLETEQDHHHDEVEIYSKRAIWGFTIFFGTIFGGVLLMLNLRAAGFKRAAISVLLFSITYTLIASVLLSRLGKDASIYGLIANVTGGAILTEYFFKRYFPEDDYYPKDIWKPLIISLLIVITISIILYMNGGLKALNGGL